MVRLLSAPAFQFKGTGWYVTDYAKKGGSKESESKESSKTKDSSAASKSGSSESD
jgi:predicted nucleic acid-binding Zn ribbon protein